MKKLSDYTVKELIELDLSASSDAIRVEALHRGITPRISVPESLMMSEWTGYQHPAESTKVFRIKTGMYVSQFGWLDEEKAQKALEGMIIVEERSWEARKLRLTTEEPKIVIDWIGTVPNQSKMEKFDGFQQNTDEFDKFVDKCVTFLTALKSEVHRCKMAQVKRDEYLRLAGGNVQIATAFWTKTEGTATLPLDPDIAIDRIVIDWVELHVAR